MVHYSIIYILFSQPSNVLVDWPAEDGFDSWNLYRGDLEVLRDSGIYTQAPGSNPLARRECGLHTSFLPDLDIPDSGQVAF